MSDSVESRDGDPNAWIGRSERVSGLVDSAPARGFAALMDRDPAEIAEGGELPAGWHWFYLVEPVRRSDWGADGHPKRGGFLPPIPLPRRMWVGGRMRFGAPLRIGERAQRESEIASVQEKQGRSGRFTLVTVRHRVWGAAGMAVDEEQDLVYREAARPGAPAAPAVALPEGAGWTIEFPTDPVVLFRFSELTRNGHRIHYDHPYATGVEGYPGLVVHGPLMALLLLESARTQHGRAPRTLSYRAVSPLFAGEPLQLSGRSQPDDDVCLAWVSGPRGLVMQAEIGWAEAHDSSVRASS